MDIADLLLKLDETSKTPLYRQVYEGLRNAIVEGRLPPGTRIPSTRRLAEYLAVSRTTILVAFDQLVAEGLVVGAVGSGSRVCDHLPPPPPADAGEDRMSAASTDVRLSRRGSYLVDLPRPSRPLSRGSKPFRTGQPPVDGFPLEIWRRLASRCYRRLSTADLYHGAPWGHGRLREAIATVALGRGIRCDARQVIVVASAQEALELICRVLLDPGDHAWLEDPAWSGGHAALLAADAHVIPVPVDSAGMQVHLGITSSPQSRLAYVTPSHQYPTGVTMSLERRMLLLEWAADRDAWIIEDDYDSEFRYADRPLPALQSLDQAGRVIYVGTFNKTMFPAVRMAYLIAPVELVDSLRSTRAIGGQHPPIIDQAVLSDFIEDGHYARHVKHARRLGRQRRDALVDAVARSIDGLELTHTSTGLHTVGWLPKGLDDRRVSVAALRHGVEAAALSAFAIHSHPQPGLVLGYGSLMPQEIADGVERLAEAIEEVRGQPHA